MKVIWTNEALKALSEIEEFISRGSPANAGRFINYLIEQAESIVNNPQIGRRVPEISNPYIREIIVKKYRIVYKLRKENIDILTVFEGHRLLRIDDLDIN